ncbi:MAG TPA: LacI family DNA-binding transcriptional regulator [Anaerolineae bacterium]|nr:LacI family DNA-binding transcriptional regulator [Anaerolineae bacterium]
MAATMRDVAQAAGVSIKTVSRVVNKQGEVSDETRRRVLATIQELGYRPSKVARALVTQRTDTLGLILGDISNPLFSEVARGVLDTAQAKEYDVFLCNSDYDPDQEIRALNSLADHNVGGTIIFPCWENREKLGSFAGLARPLVVVNRILYPDPGMSLVLNDIRRGARLAVDHLAGKGHRSIGMLAGRAAPLQVMERVQGFREGLRAHGLPVVDDWIVADDCNADVERGYRAARRLVTLYPQVTAVFAYNDLIAAGAIQACRELGRRVPGDLAIVGFDNIRFAAMVQPPLTTVHIDKYELGRQAVTRLMEMLNDPGSDLKPIHLGVELVIREST